MKIKTSELSGEALNYAVARSFGVMVKTSYNPLGGGFLVESAGNTGIYCRYTSKYTVTGWRLIDEHLTAFHRDSDGTCWATVGMSQCSGNDILEAFLRALVTERSGKEVDVPDALVREDKE